MTKRNWLLKTTLAVLLSTSMVAIGEPGQASALTITQGKQVIKAGEKYLGTPYKYASSRYTKSTMDCSEFTMWAYKEGVNIDLGKGGARSQYKKGTRIKRSELRVGDLVFFSTGATMKYAKGTIERIGHVGIYAGNNKVLHTYGKGGVRYSSMADGWWDDHYEAAARFTK
ncbi:C40 family peptidase [Brevibacillus sp. SYSU BS000544]|uniref:C40 family peptidase n=1 Tax=Brevibacillus sp. SYSU BS000544 TaxID=3416443 RepID=UPI003CE50801